MQLLHIDSAITGAQSVSRQLTAQTVDAWRTSHPQALPAHTRTARQ